MVNLDNMVKLLSYNLDPRLRHSRISFAGPSGMYRRLLAVYVSLLDNIGVLYQILSLITSRF